jgi:arylsulfatase A-like enzyme
MIDLAPTFLEAFGGPPQPHILEGRSLMPWLHGKTPDWRATAISEYDYAFDLARIRLSVPLPDARLYMVTDGRWKYIHADAFAPMLFDLTLDPQELTDLGTSPDHAPIRARLYEALSRWSRTTRTRTTIPDADITAGDAALQAYDTNINGGILIGYWDEAEVAAEKAKRAAFRAAEAAKKPG